jgi:uncharacterized membrane protein
METFRPFIETVGSALDALGVALIAIGLVFALSRFVVGLNLPDSYKTLRQNIGRAILLGLEVLVAADIIRTVAVTPTLGSVAILGGIVLIRTFLSISLQVELDGRWPWARPDAPAVPPVER